MDIVMLFIKPINNIASNQGIVGQLIGVARASNFHLLLLIQQKQIVF